MCVGQLAPHCCKVVGLCWWCLEKSLLAPSVALSNETLYVSLLLLVQRCVYCMCVWWFQSGCCAVVVIYIVSVRHLDVIFK